MSAQLDALRAYVSSRPTAPNGTAGATAGPTVLVVGSGKGGSGTSVVAALLALAAAAAGRRTLLVDADAHVGPQRYLLGIPGAASLADLRAGLEVDALATPVSTTLSVVAGGPGASGTAFDAAEQRALLRRAATLYPKHDLIVVDGGSRLDTVCACCESGGTVPTRLLVVAGTDPIALAASYALVKAAVERTAALAGGPVAADVIVNRHDDDAAQSGFAQIADACRDFLGLTVRLAGALPDDGCLDVALRAGMPLQDAASGSPAAVAMQGIADRLLAELARSARPTARPAASPYGAAPSSVRSSARPLALGALR